MLSKRRRANIPADRKQHGYAAPRPTVDQILASQARFNKVSTDFLKLDLETALTFTQLASQARDRDKRERNRHAARKAYDTVLHLIDRVTLSDAEASFFQGKLAQLKLNLIELGEDL